MEKLRISVLIHKLILPFESDNGEVFSHWILNQKHVFFFKVSALYVLELESIKMLEPEKEQ